MTSGIGVKPDEVCRDFRFASVSRRDEAGAGTGKNSPFLTKPGFPHDSHYG